MRSVQSVGLLLATLFAGLSYAFLFPLTSLYLVNELGASPLMMGVFMAMMMSAGMLVSTWLGKKSDAGWRRKHLVFVGQTGFSLMILIMIFTRSYALALLAAVTVMSVASTTLPQLFTMGRTHADAHLGKHANLYVSLMRAAIAIAWVVGPPMAFVLHSRFGFTGSFLAALAAGLTVVGILLAVSETSEVKAEDSDQPTEKPVSWTANTPLVLFLIATFAMFAASNMYQITIPLYITRELMIDAQWVGNLMGLAAFIEVPVMILAGMYGSRVGLRRLMIIGVSAGGLFFLGLTQTDSIEGLLMLQLLNGLFVGITASVGIVLVQDLMKKSIGLATTLFNNAQQAAVLMGNFSAGAIAQWFGFGQTFMFGVALIIVSIILLILMKHARPVAQVRLSRA